MGDRPARLRAGGVVVHGDRVLLLRKRLNDEYRLPKGGVEPGEDPSAAALREVAEETGFTDLVIVADLGEIVAEYRTASGWVESPQHWYLIHLRSQARAPRAAKDARRFEVAWHDLPDALERISFASERAALKRAASG